MPDLKSFAIRYKNAIDTYFKHDEERAFYEVTELSKQLVLERHGPDVLLELHSNCLKSLVCDLDPIAISKAVVNANEVLLNGMMAYAMSYYSFLELLDQEKLKEKDALQRLEVANSALAAANTKLLQLDQLKSMFIASMSHELRTPLNSVIGFSSILLNEWIGPQNEEQKKSLSSILRSGKHLLSLINDVIDVSKIESGTIEVVSDDFELAELLAEVEQTLAQEAQEQGLFLTVQRFRLAMHTDRRRLLQCLLNLAGNAIKFTEQGGVTVTIRHDLGQSEVTIVITDTGIGIAAEDQAKIYQAFSRIPSPISSRVSGTGLGLYLTQKIVNEFLHGSISLTSEPGSGSTFRIAIPCRIEGDLKQGLAPAAVRS